MGDWEHITVRLHDLKPTELYYAYHGCGDKQSWWSVRKVDGHPIIYSAKGSHGSWLSTGSHIYKRFEVPVDIPVHGTKARIYDLTDETSQGDVWDTWNRVEGFDWQRKLNLVGNQDHRPGQSFPSWLSDHYGSGGNGIDRWGYRENAQKGTCLGGQCQLVQGPTGPNRKHALNHTDFTLPTPGSGCW